MKALAFLAGNQDAFERFVALTGLGLDDLRARAGEPEFLGGVLDFLLQDEPLLLQFAEAEGLPPEAPLAARRKLPGGENHAEW